MSFGYFPVMPFGTLNSLSLSLSLSLSVSLSVCLSRYVSSWASLTFLSAIFINTLEFAAQNNSNIWCENYYIDPIGQYYSQWYLFFLLNEFCQFLFFPVMSFSTLHSLSLSLSWYVSSWATLTLLSAIFINTLELTTWDNCECQLISSPLHTSLSLFFHTHTHTLRPRFKLDQRWRVCRVSARERQQCACACCGIIQK